MTKKWCPRTDLNCRSRLRRPVLYPAELRGHRDHQIFFTVKLGSFSIAPWVARYPAELRGHTNYQFFFEAKLGSFSIAPGVTRYLSLRSRLLPYRLISEHGVQLDYSSSRFLKGSRYASSIACTRRTHTSSILSIPNCATSDVGLL